MRVELRIAEDVVACLLPVVQHAQNHTPSPKRNGRAPITAHTQHPAVNALSAYRTDEGVEEISPACWRSGGNRIGWSAAAVANTKRANERDRRNAHPKARAIQMDVGDYVLVGNVSQRRSKLQIRWFGPRRVVQAITDWIFVVGDLQDGKQSTHHVSRIRLFAAKDLLVTQDLMDHVAYVKGGHIVKELRDCRFDKAHKHWTVLVKRMGLREAETTCEPVANLVEDVPVLVRNFVLARGNEANVREMAHQCSLSNDA
jgi:hypothetical protein